MVEVEEIELELGLSLGGTFKKTVEKIKPELRSNCLVSGLDSCNGVEKKDSNQKPHVKREIQAFKRMEVKRKREEKKGSGNRIREFNLESECKRVLKKEKKEVVNGAVPCMLTAPFHVVQGPHAMVPFVPCWFTSEKNVGGIDGVRVNDCDVKVKSNGSSKCSSPVVSDYQSSSREDGGSTESQSHSTNSFAESIQLKNSNEINIKRNQPEEIVSSNPMISKQCNNVVQDNSKQNNVNETAQLPQNQKTFNKPQMPYVSTTGNGPNGKTVNGFLYKYSKCDEVSIVCVCHGSTFSPAEFVQHAGGTDISHPLRHIRVISC